MRISRIFLSILLLCSIIPVSSFATQNQKTALVIGNSAYKSVPLSNPVNDANDIATALGKVGFEVLIRTDATQREMKEAIRLFGQRLHTGGVGLFFYAGHGIQVNGRNYLIPIGVEIRTQSDVEYEAVDAGRVLGQMEDAGNGLNIVILDACRDNPFSRSFRSSRNGLNRMSAPVGSIVAYATAPGDIAADGEGRNGLYTTYLLKHMMTAGLPLEQFFKHVRRDVRNFSQTNQIPWTESSFIGDFSFIPKSGQEVNERERIEQERIKLERLKAEIETMQNTPSLDTIGQTIKHASISTEVTALEKGAPQPRFEKDDDGVILDTLTGLEWYAVPERITKWDDANRWIKKLEVSGGGWRMPALSELRGLYQINAGPRNMTPLFNNTSWFLWSSETKDPSSSWTKQSSHAWCFDFNHGAAYYYKRKGSTLERAFAVRFRK
jgi:hypothetical protein